MDIDEYLWRNRRTVRDFAIKLGITENSVLKYKHKRGAPKLLIALKIVKESNGQITIEELLPPKELEELKKWVPS